MVIFGKILLFRNGVNNFFTGNKDNIAQYAKLGADFISVGRLTHSAPAADLSMRMVTL